MRKWRIIVGATLLALTAGVVLAAHGGSGRTPDRTSVHGVVALANTSVASPARTSGRKVLSGSPSYGLLQFDGSSPAVRDLPTVSVRPTTRTVLANDSFIRGFPARVADPVMQSAPGNAPAPAPSLVFDGLCDGFGTACAGGFSDCGCLPPDTEGEIGATQYVAAVNNSFAVFDKTNGAVLKAATTVRSLWPSGVCAADANSDPIVLYDQLAGRWFISILEVQSLGASTNALCIAISKTGDATGQYWLYSFDTGGTLMDYPKYGVWPGAYYGTANEFPANAQLSTGVGAFAFERAQMLIGAPARYVTYDEGAPCPPGNPVPTCGYGFFAGQLPADLDGSRVPPSAPGLIVAVDDPTSLPGGSPPSPPGAPGWDLRIWKFSVDWSTHPNPTSTFGVGANHDADFVVPVAMFARTQCVYGHPPASCVPQSDVNNAGPAPEGLDVLGDRLMNRAAYRNFGDHQSLVLNLSVVSADPNNAQATRISPRWMEVQNPSGVSGSPTIYQQSTYALADTVQHPLWRWMGSIAQDAVGDIALGYSASGPLDFPSIRYSGQLASKLPGMLNTLTESETVVPEVTPGYGGPQTQAEGRWGDYSDMTIDPVDDCTFWYTQEYLETNLLSLILGDWRTRIAAFKLNPTCQKPTAVAVAGFAAAWTKAGVGLSWRTATETEIAGFNVWRSTGKSWRKVNRALVSAKQTGQAAGAAYRLLDRSVRRGGYYNYRLQVVQLNGKHRWYGVGTVPAR